MAAIRTVLADDHELLRTTLGTYLDGQFDIEVVASVADAQGAVDAVREFSPDIVLLDVDMPGPDPFIAAESILAMPGGSRVIFLSAHTNDLYIDRALAAEASGYLSKGEPPEQVLDAIRRAHRGVATYSPEVQARLVVDGSAVRLGRGATPRTQLTDREIEVIRHVSKGLTRVQIAETMSLSRKTVDRHIENVMRKLGINDRVHLVRYAIRERIVPL